MEEFAVIIDIDWKELTQKLIRMMPLLELDETFREEDSLHPWEVSLAADPEEVFQQDDSLFLMDMLDPLGNYIPRLSQIREQLIESAGLSSSSEMGLGDLMIDDERNVEKDNEWQMMQLDLHSALDNLPEREANILRMRYGLNDETRIFTLEEVGRIINVTRERVRQLETQAKNRLCNSSAATDLRAYLNA